MRATPTCCEVGRWGAAWIIAVVLPAGLVGGPYRTAVTLAFLNHPGAGLPLPFHQSLTPTQLLQEAFFNIFKLDPGLFLLPKVRWVNLISPQCHKPIKYFPLITVSCRLSIPNSIAYKKTSWKQLFFFLFLRNIVTFVNRFSVLHCRILGTRESQTDTNMTMKKTNLMFVLYDLKNCILHQRFKISGLSWFELKLEMEI